MPIVARSWLGGVSLWASVILGILVGTGNRAAADDVDRVDAIMDVQPGATCVQSVQLAEHVASWLGGADIPEHLTIEVVGSARDPRAVFMRVLRDGRPLAHRAFEPGPARCSHLHAAVALAIALTLKASLVEELAPPADAALHARPLAWSLRTAALFEAWVLPCPGAGLSLGVGLGVGEHLELRLDSMGLGAFGASLGQGEGTFDAALVAGRAQGCMHRRWSRPVDTALCLGVSAGTVRVAGADVRGPERAHLAWLALTQTAEVAIAVTRHWSLGIEAGLVISMHDLAVGLETSEGDRVGVRTFDRFGLLVGLGPSYRF